MSELKCERLYCDKLSYNVKFETNYRYLFIPQYFVMQWLLLQHLICFPV